MTSGLTAFAALSLLISSASAWAQTVDQGTSANGTAPVDPAVATPAPPPAKPRQVLLDMIKTLTQPRDPAGTAGTAVPVPLPAEPTGTVVTPAPAPTVVTPVPPKPVVATLPRPRTVPGVKIAPVRPAPRPVPPRDVTVAPVAPAMIDQVPLAAEPSAPAIPAPTPMAAETSAAEPAQPVAVTEAAHRPALWPWLLAGAMVAAAAGIGAQKLRHRRRLARTRAAVALAPRIDLAAGRGGPIKLAFAKPTLAIRARLDEVAHG